MRISYYLVVPCALLVIVSVWLAGTTGRDFTKPPSSVVAAFAVKLAKASNDHAEKSNSPELPIVSTIPSELAENDPQSTDDNKDDEAVEIGDLTVSPSLNAYSSVTGRGSSYLIKLAQHLESLEESERALLAWERVLDSSTADPEQKEISLQAIKSLKDQVAPWIVDPSVRTTIVIHAICDKKTATKLDPILEETAVLLSNSTSGMIQFEKKITISSANTKISPPVALWCGKKSHIAPASKMLTVVFQTNDPSVLSVQLHTAAYKLLRVEISSAGGLEIPPKFDAATHSTTDLLQYAITRLHWEKLAQYFTNLP